MKEQWIDFDYKGLSESGKTKIWVVISKQGGANLGKISWHGPWRKYAFSPFREFWTLFEEDCLRNIADFIEQKTKEYREKK